MGARESKSFTDVFDLFDLNYLNFDESHGVDPVSRYSGYIKSELQLRDYKPGRMRSALHLDGGGQGGGFEVLD